MARKRVLYGIPSGGHPNPFWVTSAMSIRMSAVGSKLVDHGVNDMISVRAPVQMARTQILAFALSEGFDYLVMHDDDLEIAQKAGKSTIDDAVSFLEESPRVGIYGLTYLSERPLPAMTKYHPDYGMGAEHCNIISRMPSEPFPVAGVGFGWVMLRISALREVAANTDGPLCRFPQAKDIAGGTVELGEDYDLCDRFHRLGWDVVADPRVTTRHHKDSGPLLYEHDAWERRIEDRRLYLPEGAEYVLPGSREPLQMPPGTIMRYREPFEIGAPQGAQIIEIDGMDCLDMTPVRMAARKRAA